MFKRIFVENEIEEDIYTRKILRKFSSIPIKKIHRIDQIFGRVKKPYLQKRTNFNLYIGKKRGTLVKQTPSAYGISTNPHYYFIHSYNCIYECQYCYLQGFFHSSDMVFFVNHQEIGEEIRKTALRDRDKNPWFHGGEFSDSLALSHITGEIPFYFNLFRNLPWAFLELRTKSVNIRSLLETNPASNIIISYSLAPQKQVDLYDDKTPSLQKRLKAIQKLASHGHHIGIHLDPIIYQDDLREHYEELLKQLTNILPPSKIKYISLGVVRFTKKVYHQVEKKLSRFRSSGRKFHQGT